MKRERQKDKNEIQSNISFAVKTYNRLNEECSMHCLSQHILKSFPNTFYTPEHTHMCTYIHMTVVHVNTGIENQSVYRMEWNEMKQDDRIHARHTNSIFIWFKRVPLKTSVK